MQPQRIRGLLLAWALALMAAPGWTQNNPSTEAKPLKFIVPFPPGSGTDTSARYYARKITELTGLSRSEEHTSELQSH